MRKQVSPRACPPGKLGKLHTAATQGDLGRVQSALSERPDAIDQGDQKGQTALMLAAVMGHGLVTLFLVGKGANPSMESDAGTALLAAAQFGHLGVVQVLLKAGAYMEATTSTLSSTALHLAAQRGHLEVVKELIAAGANVNCRRSDGATPLVSAATKGHVQIIRRLLLAKADPLLAMGSPTDSYTFTPLDVSAQHNQPGVVRELIERLGIERCGGPTGGLLALDLAAHEEGLECMTLLADAGVTDTGRVMHHAVEYGCEEAVRFLLRRRTGSTSDSGRYADSKDRWGGTPLAKSIAGDTRTALAYPRIARLLVEAGATTSSAIRLTNVAGRVMLHDSALAFTVSLLGFKTVNGQPASEEHLRRLEAIRRLLLQEPAVHAVSWVWPSVVSRNLTGRKGMSAAPSETTLVATLPVLRRRARRRRMALASIFRRVSST